MPNILKREFSVSAPNKAWVSDITYIPTDEGWLYLAGIKKPFNGELVGYAMSERMTQKLVMQALFRAAASKLFTQIRSSQYCAHDYQNLLQHNSAWPLPWAVKEIAEYIEIFYNRQRKQERLGYLSPAELHSDIMQIYLLLKPMVSILTAHLRLSFYWEIDPFLFARFFL